MNCPGPMEGETQTIYVLYPVVVPRAPGEMNETNEHTTQVSVVELITKGQTSEGQRGYLCHRPGIFLFKINQIDFVPVIHKRQ